MSAPSTEKRKSSRYDGGELLSGTRWRCWTCPNEELPTWSVPGHKKSGKHKRFLNAAGAVDPAMYAHNGPDAVYPADMELNKAHEGALLIRPRIVAIPVADRNFK